MKFVQYQDCKSPHRLPLARELVHRLGVDNFRYVYRDADQSARAAMGWNMAGTDEPWQLLIVSHPEEARELIENAEVLLTGMRVIDLFERRAAKGLSQNCFASTVEEWNRLCYTPRMKEVVGWTIVRCAPRKYKVAGLTILITPRSLLKVVRKLFRKGS